MTGLITFLIGLLPECAEEIVRTAIIVAFATVLHVGLAEKAAHEAGLQIVVAENKHHG